MEYIYNFKSDFARLTYKTRSLIVQQWPLQAGEPGEPAAARSKKLEFSEQRSDAASV
jgi:hypothetical protein